MVTAEAADEASGDRHDGLSPLRELGVIATQQASVTKDLEHCELYTLEGLLTILWHGDPGAERVVLMCGGAMGGLLGPADGLYQDLATALVDQGIATMRVSYRRPNDLQACTHDLAAAADLASRRGGRRFITMGHSFGGAIAVRTALMLGSHCAGVVTLATQSAGCEHADALHPDTDLLLFHGDRDELLPAMVSETVHGLAGRGELIILEGDGHLLSESGEVLRSRLLDWIPAAFAGTRATANEQPEQR